MRASVPLDKLHGTDLFATPLPRFASPSILPHSEQVAFGFTERIYRSCTGVSKDGLIYDDRPTDRKWTPLGPTDSGGYTSARGGTCLAGNSRAFEKPKPERCLHGSRP